MTSHDGTIDRDAETGPPNGAADPPSGSASALVAILDQYLADLQAGAAPDQTRLLAEHPELADELRSCLAGIDFIHRTTTSRAGAEEPVQLGEFRILREVGRGGMGVVYEAEQTTLRRRVALKVLRFGIVADEGAMQRFQREAETVARLHHTNIVPIFAVGSERGVHYFAMQFIGGRNLAEVLNEGQAQERPLRPQDVAQWGLQAAEALEYAHRRGVIHRDVKPSNLLLDPEGIVWLTDFGLAKRADEATLTIAGTLMGTPRYMSPEQAESVSRPIDHRTDIYSLGATLYELATGRPLFEASTPHGVIHRILADEPVPPRQVRPGLPRDLETVILTCLAKDPARRYASAHALADDLRALLDGRPIQARRVGPLGRSVRWVKRQRRTVGVAAAAALAAVLLAGVVTVGWTLYSRAQLSSVSLATTQPHLAAEVLAAGRDQVIVPDVSLPTRQPLDLPAGDHRVRLSAPGQPTETFDLRLHRGASRTFDVGLGDRPLWEPIAADMQRTVHLVERDGAADVVQLLPQEIRYLDGATGRTVWKFDLSPTPGRPNTSAPIARPGSQPETQRLMEAFAFITGSGMIAPGLVRPAPDLDGDGVGDLVWAGRNAPGLWAFSGRQHDEGRGRELWLYRARRMAGGAVIGLPAVADADGDGTLDLIATFEVNASTWVEAVSGRSGKSLWSFDVPRLSVQPVFAGDTPRPSPAQVGRFGGETRVFVVHGTGVLLLDPATGQPAWQRGLGGSIVRQSRLADVDGDANLDILLVAQGPQGQFLEAISPAADRTLWSRPIQASWRSREPFTGEAEPDWPLAVDLDGDGSVEIAVPASSSIGSISSADVEVLRGRDGRPLWRHRVRTPVFATQVDRFIAGPDLDGDGHRELFVASVAAERGRSLGSEDSLFIDALSGRDGRGLWWWRRPTSQHNDEVAPLRWAGTGPDGWPQLLVDYRAWPDRPASVCMLSAGTGALVGELPGAFDPRVVDLNGDGPPDLAYRTSQSGHIRMSDGRLHALRGRPPAPWGRLGLLDPVPDLDGDGLDDLLESRDDGMTAHSGRDGRILWDTGRVSTSEMLRGQWRLVPQHDETGAHADIDGDGTPDLLVTLPAGGAYNNYDGRKILPIPLRAVSGRTGRRLWTAEELLNPTGSATVFVRTKSARRVDLDRDGAPEIVAVVHLSGPFSPNLDQLWLMAFSGRDGRLRWRQLLAERKGPVMSDGLERFSPGIEVGELDEAAGLDIAIAVPAPAEPGQFGVELRAFAGRDGHPLWSHGLPPRVPLGGNPDTVLPAIAVGDLDGHGVPGLIAVDHVPRIEAGQIIPWSPGPRVFRVMQLDGRTGRLLGEPWPFRDDRPPFEGPTRPVLARLDGRGRHVAALWIRDGKDTRIALLDARGKVVGQRVTPPLAPAPWSSALFARDLTGDGGDELVCILPVDGSTVHVFGRDLERPLWTQSFKGMAQIREIIPGGPDRPATVVVGGLHNTVVGLDGATGRTLWRGQGRGADSGPAYNDIPLFDSTMLRDTRPGGTPRVVSRAHSSTVCLLTLPATPAAAVEVIARDRAPAVLRPDATDPRRVRPLPWIVMTRDTIGGALPAAAMAVGLLVLPGLALAWVLRRRPWKLGRLLLVPAIVGVTFAAARAWDGDVPPHLVMLRAPEGLPVVVLPALSVVWLIRRQWRRLAALAVVLVVIAIVLGAIQIHLDASRVASWQRYSWDDWYWILAPASYFAGILLMLGWILAALARLAHRGWRRAFAPPGRCQA